MSIPKILCEGDKLSGTSAFYNLSLELGWESDWNGDEVGYPDVPVVGLYTWGTLNVYIDVEKGEVLEIWSDVVEEDDDYAQSIYGIFR